MSLVFFFDGLAKKSCCLALSFESVIFRPRFTPGKRFVWGKDNNTGTYLDQTGCSLAATRLGWMINGSCSVGINFGSMASERFHVVISESELVKKAAKRIHLF